MNSGKTPAPKITTLSERDLAILKFIGTFRVANPDVLFRKFFAGLQIDAMKSTLRRLMGKRPNYLYLQPQTIEQGRVVYLLTVKGARIAGVPKSYARDIRQAPLFESMAVLRFLNPENGPPRELIRSQTLRTKMGFQGERFRSNRYFLEGAEADRSLGFLVIDRLGDIRKIRRRVAEVLQRLSRKPEFAKYFQKRRFDVTVLVVTEDRRKELRSSIFRYLDRVLKPPFPWPHSVGPNRWPVRVEYVPKLLSYLPGRKGPNGP